MLSGVWRGGIRRLCERMWRYEEITMGNGYVLSSDSKDRMLSTTYGSALSDRLQTDNERYRMPSDMATCGYLPSGATLVVYKCLLSDEDVISRPMVA